jgi:predicted transcriptional regulator
VPNSEAVRKATQVDWKRSITKHAVTCLECGNSFRQLSLRHLRVHDLDPNSYRTKYGIPSTQPLSSRDATARRRELALQNRSQDAWQGIEDGKGKPLACGPHTG